MTATEAEILLWKNKIDPLIYSIGSPKQSQCHVVEEKNGTWITYNWERGLRHSEKTYPNEAAAIAAFIDKVVRIASLNERRTIVLN